MPLGELHVLHCPQNPSHFTGHRRSSGGGHGFGWPPKPFLGGMTMLCCRVCRPVALSQVCQGSQAMTQSTLQGRSSGARHTLPPAKGWTVMVTERFCLPLLMSQVVHGSWVLTQSTMHVFCSLGGQGTPVKRWPVGQLFKG